MVPPRPRRRLFSTAVALAAALAAAASVVCAEMGKGAGGKNRVSGSGFGERNKLAINSLLLKSRVKKAPPGGGPGGAAWSIEKNGDDN